ncbi:O-antigen/teichoic acid export membrane protein [Ancylomarina subtilis]|uniref:O-antigen/teichoic acid export membrane protein n=1 Tax=Ancylomarina subtilis TaxID=1639035 RepID=A0A4V2FT29_9BACT|nr:oligosaccharide flippase family protein [Ancylomarina subtilis]RZT96495.1 O-antigen/teichoic acid export membrane protein [Ancylomarina subtilis]
MNFLLKVKSVLENKFVNGSLWTFISFGIVGVAGLILQTLVTNTYGIANLGVYSQIVSFYALFSCISVSGIESSTLKHTSEYSKDKTALAIIYSSSQLLIIVWSTLVLLALSFTIYFLPNVFSSNEVRHGLLYVLPGIFLFALNKNSNSFLSGLRNMKLYSLIKMLRWGSLMILTGILCIGRVDFIITLKCYTAVELMLFIIFVFINKEYIRFVNTSNKWYKIHFKYGAVSMVSVILSAVQSNIMILISGYYLTLNETGLFSLLMMFSNVFLLVITTIQVNFNPVFAKDWADGSIELINEKLSKIFRVTKYSAPLMFILAMITFYVYDLFFINTEVNSIYYFAILSIGTVAVYLIGWTAPMLTMAGYIIGTMHRSILLSIIQLVFPVILLPLFGFEGAIFSYLFVQIISVFIGVVFIKYYLKINLLKNFFYAKLG